MAARTVALSCAFALTGDLLPAAARAAGASPAAAPTVVPGGYVPNSRSQDTLTLGLTAWF